MNEEAADGDSDEDLLTAVGLWGLKTASPSETAEARDTRVKGLLKGIGVSPDGPTTPHFENDEGDGDTDTDTESDEAPQGRNVRRLEESLNTRLAVEREQVRKQLDEHHREMLAQQQQMML